MVDSDNKNLCYHDNKFWNFAIKMFLLLGFSKELVFGSSTSDTSDCNWTRTQNHLVLKRTLNHLAKLVK